MPILPRPTMPRVFLKSSMPEKLFRSHSPRFIDAAACGTGAALTCGKAGAMAAVCGTDGATAAGPAVTPRADASETTDANCMSDLGSGYVQRGAGELAEALEKQMKTGGLDMVNVSEELGDVDW